MGLGQWPDKEGFVTWQMKYKMLRVGWVNEVLNRTIVVDGDWHFDNLCSNHLQSLFDSEDD